MINLAREGQAATASTRAWSMPAKALGIVFVLTQVQGYILHGSVLNATAVVLDVPPDPALARRMFLAWPKVYWKQVLRGDIDSMRVMAGMRHVSIKGMPTSEPRLDQRWLTRASKAPSASMQSQLIMEMNQQETCLVENQCSTIC